MSKHLSRDYFLTVQAALKKAGLAEPVLLLDRQRLNHNIDNLRDNLPDGMNYRIVAKSLPSAALLEHVGKRAGTQRFAKGYRVQPVQRQQPGRKMHPAAQVRQTHTSKSEPPWSRADISKLTGSP